VELPRPEWQERVLSALLQRQDLPPADATSVFRDMLAGRVDDIVSAGVLTALRIKGEAPHELVAAANCMSEMMVRLVPVRGPTLDTCGTGGDDSGTFNISTAAALVAAACGVPVVKHGNRAVSSRSGSADVLHTLGVPIDAGVDWAQRCLDRLGFAFCYAPQFHPGLSRLSAVRRKLGFRSIFNMLGPLVNPASAEYQLIGVGQPEQLDTLAAATAALTQRRAILVCGFDGLDEVTLAAPTMVRLVESGHYVNEEWEPGDFGLPRVQLCDVQAENAEQSAAIITRVLAGELGPHRSLVLANTAAALFTAERVGNLHDGVLLAERAIDSGAVQRLLEQLREPHQR